jgi:hypothetical protein
MQIKELSIKFSLSFAIFLMCCIIILFASSFVSKSSIATYFILIVTLISLLSWPVFLVKLITEIVKINASD